MVAAALLAAGAGPATGRGERMSHAEMVTAGIDSHIVPRLARLRRATEALAQSLRSFCARPGNSTLRSRAETSFGDTVASWGAIDFVRFGPAADGHRLERFFFWPDPRAVTARQLEALLARRDARLLAPGALAGQSAAVQGLGALEILLFEHRQTIEGSDEAARYRCAYAQAVAANLDTIAGEIEAAWTGPKGWREHMLRPGSDNPLYRDASETAAEVVKALPTGLHIAQDRHVMPRLEGALASPPRHGRVPFARSGLSGPYFEAEIASLEALYNALGLTAFVPAGKAWLESFVARAFKSLAEDGAVLPAGGGAPADADAITRLRRMRFHLNGIRQVINRELAPAAGLSLGFNELDGD
jgi:hypothetical protein